MKTNSKQTTPDHNETRKLIESTVERVKRQLLQMNSLKDLSGWVSILNVKFSEENSCDYFLEKDGGMGISPSCSLNCHRSSGIDQAHEYSVRMGDRTKELNPKTEVKPSAVPFKVWNLRMITRMSELLRDCEESLKHFN